MRAATYATTGPDSGVLRLEEVPDPVPAEGEVRVRVKVSGANPTDVRARLNPVASRTWERQVPDQDGAGVVDAVGAGVDEQLVGQRVWVYNAAHARPTGTAAQYVCLPRERVVELPEGVSFDQGAGLGVPGITAHACVFGNGAVTGKTVLVTGGAGAVGNAALQLARWGGARVLATVSTAEKAKIAEGAGADAVLRYRQDDFADQLRDAAPEGVDLVVEVAPATNLPTYADQLAVGAVVVAYARDADELSVPTLTFMRRNASLRYVYAYTLTPEQYAHATGDINAALRDGALKPLPPKRFSLDDIAAAHDAVSDGSAGKVLIDIP